jgi:UDP-N-acetylglucosamine 2-epimerase
MANAVNPYGDGRAAERIVARLRRELGTDTQAQTPHLPVAAMPMPTR